MSRTISLSLRRLTVIQTTVRKGFTLIELLVVLGIIGALVAILLPVVSSARTRAREIECQSNARGLATALIAYASVYRNFPPNIGISTTPRPQSWCDLDIMGPFFQTKQLNGSSDIRGRAAACPAEPGSIRSYSMNIWASCKVDKQVLAPGAGILSHGSGRLWRPWSRPASKLMLLAESWSSSGSVNLSASNATIGTLTLPATPGHRFGGKPGLVPLLITARYGLVNCELSYARHRPSMSRGRRTDPIGRITIAYADGHVAMKSNDDLVDEETGLSRLDTLWSPMDYELNQ